jgi:hypothetical protein
MKRILLVPGDVLESDVGILWVVLDVELNDATKNVRYYRLECILGSDRSAARIGNRGWINDEWQNEAYLRKI